MKITELPSGWLPGVKVPGISVTSGATGIWPSTAAPVSTRPAAAASTSPFRITTVWPVPAASEASEASRSPDELEDRAGRSAGIGLRPRLRGLVLVGHTRPVRVDTSAEVEARCDRDRFRQRAR